ncbi:MAG: hypothetical protein U0992_15390 [Planctomycetaceae bacterium]
MGGLILVIVDYPWRARYREGFDKVLMNRAVTRRFRSTWGG